MIDVSYGILHYNPGGNDIADEAFVKSVASLAENRNPRLRSEVYVIDQGNPEAQQEIGRDLARQYGFNFVSLSTNVGISRGINWLAHISRGQYVSLVTSDTEFTPNLDNILIDHLFEDQDIMMICPASDKSDYPYQRQGYQDGGIIPTIGQELTIQFWPRRTFERIGYFDENWKACYENVDYSLRCILDGGYAAVSHDAFCPHDYHMCTRSGARNQTYEDYIEMPDGFNQEKIAFFWERKWPLLQRIVDWSRPMSSDLVIQLREHLIRRYEYNKFLPYLQHVGY